MKVGVPRENELGETRAALVPADASRLTKLGVEVEIEPSLGEASGHSDTDYVTAGASLARSRRSLFETAAPPISQLPNSPTSLGLSQDLAFRRWTCSGTSDPVAKTP